MEGIVYIIFKYNNSQKLVFRRGSLGFPHFSHNINIIGMLNCGSLLLLVIFISLQA
jgi:hypothetical protein